MNFIYAIVMLGMGVLCIYCSLNQTPWFFNSHRARPIVKLFGMTGAKIFYIIIGVLFCVAALLSATGVITF